LLDFTDLLYFMVDDWFVDYLMHYGLLVYFFNFVFYFGDVNLM